MDKRSWPWKKKSSDKQAAEKGVVAASDTAVTQSEKSKDDNPKKPKYVQITMESYAHLTGLEDEVKSCKEQAEDLEDEVKELNQKLSEAKLEITNKENLVKQHAKVAEEAISGWEKAEAEAATLKSHLESVTLLKLTAEDRSSHLDGALKECMRQIRNLKEEHDQQLHELVLSKAKLFDDMKLELEAKIANMDQQLLRSAAENAAMSRSLHERSNMLIKLSEEKTNAEAEIELLKSNIEDCEKEISSLKYELRIAWKEVDIHNEEKNMSMRSAEVANKQHLEGVKKIAKLEAECQRLRGLVRKKLPGPAALAQMKLEVENMGRDYGESRLRRSPVTPPTLQLSQENELLMQRLLATEEETKMLKEALARSNSELQASRSMYAQTAGKLQRLEAQLKANGEQRSPRKSNSQVQAEVIDDNISNAGSSATVIMSELSHLKNEKNVDSPHKSENTNLDLMDDFLEMEKLAYLSNEPSDKGSSSEVSSNTLTAEAEITKTESSVEVLLCAYSPSGEQHGPKLQISSKEDGNVEKPQLQADPHIFLRLQSKISMALESLYKEREIEKLIVDIRSILEDMQDNLHCQLLNGVVGSAHTSRSDIQTHPEAGDITATEEMTSIGNGNSCIAATQTTNQELRDAISQIYGFIMVLGKETKCVPTTSEGDGLISKLDMLSTKHNEAINSEINLIDFVLDISHILSEASELHFNVLGFKSYETETSGSDCIDKIALPENKTVIDSSEERDPNGCSHFSDSASDPDVQTDGNLVPTSESRATSWKCSLEEFEQLKRDKDNLIVDLARCTENFESTKTELLETEQHLAEIKSQLASAQKSNSLAETQLKCMAESYESLETRAANLQTEVNLLQGKIESLDNALREERKCHQDAVIRCKNLQEQLQRIANSEAADKISQETELAAASEKLAECQETIFLLAKQLNAFRPQTVILGSPDNGRSQKNESSFREEDKGLIVSGMHLQDVQPSEVDSSHAPPQFSPSNTEVNDLLRSPISSKYAKSGSSSVSSAHHAHGFSRFFSSKTKN